MPPAEEGDDTAADPVLPAAQTDASVPGDVPSQALDDDQVSHVDEAETDSDFQVATRKRTKKVHDGYISVSGMLEIVHVSVNGNAAVPLFRRCECTREKCLFVTSGIKAVSTWQQATKNYHD